MPKCMALGLWTGATAGLTACLAPGRTAAAFCAQLRTAVARSRTRGRVAIVVADNLRTHTPAGSKLVRQLLAELQGQLDLVYTPPYDPDANRIEWLWRWTRRAVTHNHQRETFDAVQADLRDHFQHLAAQPNAVLRQVGSPFADAPVLQSAAVRSLRSCHIIIMEAFREPGAESRRSRRCNRRRETQTSSAGGTSAASNQAARPSGSGTWISAPARSA